MAQCGIIWYRVAFYGTEWHSMAQCDILWHRVAFYGTEWHTMAKSGGTLPGERRRAGREEQVAVAGRPTGQPHCKANFPQASQLRWSPFEAFSNNLILRSPKTTLAKRGGKRAACDFEARHPIVCERLGEFEPRSSASLACPPLT